jgi:hypothetical protein
MAAMSCQPRTLADRISRDEKGWEREVPAKVADAIRSLRLWVS